MNTDKTGLSFLFSIRVHPWFNFFPPHSSQIPRKEPRNTRRTRKEDLGYWGIHFHPSSFLYLVCFVVETSVFGLNRQVAKFAKLKKWKIVY